MGGNVTLIGILVWMLWGFFMGIGWTVGSWLINKYVLSRIG